MARRFDGLVAKWGLKPSQFLPAVRLNGPKGPGTPRGGIGRRMNSAERETGKWATERWKRTQRQEGGAEVPIVKAKALWHSQGLWSL
jgi:hypothetical protein